MTIKTVDLDDLQFDSDSDSGDAPEGPRSGASLYITEAGAEKLRAELRRLLTTERPKVTAEVSTAAAMGDRSENAEYIYGKKRLREIDRRLRFLQKRLEKLTVVDPTTQKDTRRVYFGATVTLKTDEGDAVTVYKLVGPDETETKAGRISVDSPVGRAIMGKKKGDAVLVARPRGEVEFTIVGIKYV